MTHEVMVPCNCDEDPCRMELYVSDVRIAYAELERQSQIRTTIENVWGCSAEVLVRG